MRVWRIRVIILHWKHNTAFIVVVVVVVVIVVVVVVVVVGELHRPHVQQLSTYEKPEAASAVLGS